MKREQAFDASTRVDLRPCFDHMPRDTILQEDALLKDVRLVKGKRVSVYCPTQEVDARHPCLCRSGVVPSIGFAWR